jgi:hypothetical protein
MLPPVPGALSSPMSLTVPAGAFSAGLLMSLPELVPVSISSSILSLLLSL